MVKRQFTAETNSAGPGTGEPENRAASDNGNAGGPAKPSEGIADQGGTAGSAEKGFSFDSPSGLRDAGSPGTVAGQTATGRPRLFDAAGRRLKKDGTPYGKRGRSKEEIPSYLKFLVGPLMMVHSVAASYLKAEELELDEDDAVKLCESGDNVLSFYNKQPPPEVAVWLGFATAVSTIYGPRIVAIRVRVKREKEAAAAKRVVPFTPKPSTLDAFPPREPPVA